MIKRQISIEETKRLKDSAAEETKRLKDSAAEETKRMVEVEKTKRVQMVEQTKRDHIKSKPGHTSDDEKAQITISHNSGATYV